MAIEDLFPEVIIISIVVAAEEAEAVRKERANKMCRERQETMLQQNKHYLKCDYFKVIT